MGVKGGLLTWERSRSTIPPDYVQATGHYIYIALQFYSQIISPYGDGGPVDAAGDFCKTARLSKLRIETEPTNRESFSMQSQRNQ